MSNNGSSKYKNKKPRTPIFIFPSVMAIIYGILLVMIPEKGFVALRSSAQIFINMLLPLCSVFVILLILNLFLNPLHIARIFGKGAGIKSILVPVAAGILSTGPIYAWYPLLSDLKRKGAASSPVAIFLYNRAVKPFLLPVMIAYFGWEYPIILTACMILGSFMIGYVFNTLMSNGW